ncbi:MAG: hypothetical protein FWC65_05150 [Treponema sp.]|nr:hypothetical protein [Treponema sp.]
MDKAGNWLHKGSSVNRLIFLRAAGAGNFNVAPPLARSAYQPGFFAFFSAASYIWMYFFAEFSHELRWPEIFKLTVSLVMVKLA